MRGIPSEVLERQHGELNVTSSTPNTNNLYDQTGGTTQVDGNLTTYVYDMGAGNTEVTNGGDLTTNTYDAAGGTTSIDHGGSLSTTTLYDQTGSTAATTDAGTITTATYDMAGGTTTVEAGGKLNATTAYDQTGGTTDVDSTLTSPNVSVSGGTLKGMGTIQGDVSQTGGTLEPGDALGTLTVSGNVALSNTDFVEDIAGAAAGTDYSVLDVTGNLDFGASDTLNPLDEMGFNPTNGETFDIINAASIAGTFANNDIAFDGGTFMVGYDSSGCAAGYSDCVVLTWNAAVSPAPEPGSLFLLGISLLLGLGWATRRRLQANA
ncbi:MAG: PEP-CTERM sorting domain-containing protein [Terriglobia bacterium]